MAMQRQLALADLRPGHPFRAELQQRTGRRPRPVKRRDDSDLKLFVLSFTAFFVCIYTLIF